jgi:deoxycytidine triphosphate deaminase/plasmid maintenance system antidote protein VapI
MTNTRENNVFRSVMEGLQQRQNLSAQDLSLRTNYSTAAISLVKSGSRKLTAEFATALSRVLGGSPETWLKVYSDATSEAPEAPEEYILRILAKGQAVGVKLGSGTESLVNHEIYNLFAKQGNRAAFRAYFESDGSGSSNSCHIDEFDESRIQPTGYDTRIGGIVPFDADRNLVDFTRCKTAESFVMVPGSGDSNEGNTVYVFSAEHFEMPNFLEGEVHPAHTLSLKVEVGNGPIIDPGFNGRLCVRVTNPLPRPVKLSVTEAFLTVRFKLLSTLPLQDSEMERAFGVRRYNSDATVPT